MARTVAERKAALRERLIGLAEARIAAGGLKGVKARDLAREAGCAVGAIYSHFDDLDALLLEVNGRTFSRIGAVVAASCDPQEPDPGARLTAMALAYLHFAADHYHLWRALFDVEMSAEGPVPQWYLDALDTLFSHIAAPVSELFPDMDARELDLMVRALFSSVHGIILLGLEHRISAVPVEQIERMIAQILSRVGNTRLS